MSRPARTAILWQAGDWRIVRERQRRCAEDDYTDYHCWEIEPAWPVERREPGFSPGHFVWVPRWYITQHPQTPRNAWGESSYLRSNPAERRRMSQAFTRLGQEWLTRHQTLVAAAPWTIRCGAVDGQGTPCLYFDAARQECRVRINATCFWGERRPVTPETECLNRAGATWLLTAADSHGCALAYYYRIIRGEYR